MDSLNVGIQLWLARLNKFQPDGPLMSPTLDGSNNPQEFEL